MKWFGKAPFARLCENCARTAAPVRVPCLYCGEPIEAGDEGVILPPIEEPLHFPCFFRTTVGSVGHQAGLCQCGADQSRPALRVLVAGAGPMHDPPGLTLREGAQAATEFWEAPASPAIRQAILVRWVAIGAERAQAKSL
jgi:hypothetical protein